MEQIQICEKDIKRMHKKGLKNCRGLVEPMVCARRRVAFQSGNSRSLQSMVTKAIVEDIPWDCEKDFRDNPFKSLPNPLNLKLLEAFMAANCNLVFLDTDELRIAEMLLQASCVKKIDLGTWDKSSGCSLYSFARLVAKHCPELQELDLNIDFIWCCRDDYLFCRLTVDLIELKNLRVLRFMRCRHDDAKIIKSEVMKIEFPARNSESSPKNSKVLFLGLEKLHELLTTLGSQMTAVKIKSAVELVLQLPELTKLKLHLYYEVAAMQFVAEFGQKAGDREFLLGSLSLNDWIKHPWPPGLETEEITLQSLDQSKVQRLLCEMPTDKLRDLSFDSIEPNIICQLMPLAVNVTHMSISGLNLQQPLDLLQVLLGAPHLVSLNVAGFGGTFVKNLDLHTYASVFRKLEEFKVNLEPEENNDLEVLNHYKMFLLHSEKWTDLEIADEVVRQFIWETLLANPACGARTKRLFFRFRSDSLPAVVKLATLLVFRSGSLEKIEFVEGRYDVPDDDSDDNQFVEEYHYKLDGAFSWFDELLAAADVVFSLKITQL